MYALGRIVGQNLRKLFLQGKCFFAASNFFNFCHVPYTSFGQNSSMLGLLKFHFRLVQRMTRTYNLQLATSIVLFGNKPKIIKYIYYIY